MELIITEEMECAVLSFLKGNALKFFEIIYELTGTMNVVISPIIPPPGVEPKPTKKICIPHPVHFREGMHIRNLLRECKDCKDWTDHDFDENWFKIADRVIKKHIEQNELDFIEETRELEPNLNQFQTRLGLAKTEYLSVRQTFEPLPRALNIAEEGGELCREERLYAEGFDFNKTKAKDAVGDILIAVLGYCIAKQWSAHNILKETMHKVITRWRSGKYTGDRNYPTLKWVQEQNETQSQKEDNRDKE